MLEDHVIVNLNATIGHHALVQKHSIVLPGARVSGHVKIGEGVLLGANSFVYQGVAVGSHTMVDALTYIRNDVLPNMICSSRDTKIYKRVL